MITQEEVIQKIKADVIEKIIGISNYSDQINQCRQILSDIVTGKEYSDLGPDYHTINVLYGEIPGIFAPREPYFSILLSGWNLLNQIQIEKNMHVYRASIAAFLAMNYRMREDKGATFRWALLTQAEDLLDNHSQGGGTGKDLLSSEFGFDDVALSKLMEISKNNLDIVSEKQNWSIPEAFSEDIVTKFAFMHPEYSLKFASDTNIVEYDINTHYLDALITRVNGHFSNTTEKGNSLEDLASYLFLLIPGLVPRRNVLEETIAFESDIVVRNLAKNSNMISDMFGRFILAECKNWEHSVGVKEVGYFLYRMRLTHARFGIIFAKNGITGDLEKETAARSLIRKAFHEDGNICIVIDETILEGIKRKSVTLLSCILSENERILFGSEKRNNE